MRNIFKTALIVGTLSTSLVVMADTPKKDAKAGSGSATAGSATAKDTKDAKAGSGSATAKDAKDTKAAGSGSAATPKKGK